jgi:hypothetical protein
MRQAARVAGIDLDFDAHPGAQRRQVFIVRVDPNAHRHALDDLTQLPLVFCAGNSENCSAAAGLMLSTTPFYSASG